MSSLASREKKKGFTLVEIMVVVAVIGILVSVVMISSNDARKKARDTQRVTDIATLKTALERYYIDHQTFQVSGGGSGGAGNGWASYTNAGDGYAKSITQELYEQGYLSNPNLKDPGPLGLTPGSIQDRGYMVYLCDEVFPGSGKFKSYSISATKEISVPSEIDYANTLCNSDATNPSPHTGTNPSNNSIVTKYGKNYAVGNKTF